MSRTALPDTATDAGFLVGFSAIGRALRHGEKAARRWIEQDGLPHRRLPSGVVVTHVDLMRQWIQEFYQDGADG